MPIRIGSGPKPKPSRAKHPAQTTTKVIRPVRGFTGTASRPAVTIPPTLTKLVRPVKGFFGTIILPSAHELHLRHLQHINRGVTAQPAAIRGPAMGGGNTRSPASTSEADWIKTLLHALGAPATPANINSLASWIARESHWSHEWGGALWTNNPLNTSQPSSGATNWYGNIKKYPTAAEGIAATAATIVQYPQILHALRSGNGICGSSLGSSFARWSGNGYTSVC